MGCGVATRGMSVRALAFSGCLLAVACGVHRGGERPAAAGRRTAPHGYRVTTSVETDVPADHAIVRGLLDESGCIQALERGAAAPVRLMVHADVRPRVHPGRVAVAGIEMLTMLPLLGLPVPAGVAGEATARLYVDGRATRTYESRRQQAYWTTLYSWRADRQRTLTRFRTTLLQDVVDQAVPDLCGGPLDE
jgi:hypothetical protein